jgi:hypothetical protein
MFPPLHEIYSALHCFPQDARADVRAAILPNAYRLNSKAWEKVIDRGLGWHVEGHAKPRAAFPPPWAIEEHAEFFRPRG